MSKWPKGITKQYSIAARQALLPIFEAQGFQKMPRPGCDGEWNQYSYDTDLYRATGVDVDIVQLSIYANRSSLARVQAVRATGFDGDPSSLKTPFLFPANQVFDLPRPFRWGFGVGTAEFYLGPPWPEDPKAAIEQLVGQIVDRLPRLFDYLETGRERWFFRTVFKSRWPLSKTM